MPGDRKASQELLSCGKGAGLSEKLLLLQPKAAPSLQTERVPTSSVLARLHSFLPQMAEANERLRLQMEDAPPGHFDIQQVDEGQRVIDMDIGLFELDGSDSDAVHSEETSDSDEDEGDVITEQSLRLPGSTSKKKVHIQVLEEQKEHL